MDNVDKYKTGFQPEYIGVVLLIAAIVIGALYFSGQF